MGGAAFHATAVVAVIVPVTVLGLTAAGSLDSRLQALGCTLILHETGEVAFRSPSGRLWATRLLEGVDFGVVCSACTLYLVAWTSWMIAARLRYRRREQRGFPVD